MNTMLKDADLVKFGRTLHVPFSPGATSDDKIHKSLDHFVGREVVVTEKLDGENTTMARARIHARSLTSSDHWTQHRVKQLYSERIKWKLDLPQFADIHRICGENLQGLHSIKYDKLAAYFYCFAIVDRQNVRFSWDDMSIFAQELGLTMAPLIKRGVYYEGFLDDIDLSKSSVGSFGIEGYVMTLADSFSMDEYQTWVAKYVRANHVTTDEHWKTSCSEENELSSQQK
jgi:hypothetical protein